MTNSRSMHLLVLLPILALGCISAFGATVAVDNTYSGWYDQTGSHYGVNENYIAGANRYNDFFVFNLSPVSGTVTAATFNVYSFEIDTVGTFTIYATTLPTSVENDCDGCVANYSGLTSGAAIGSINLAPADSYSSVAITLNDAGRSWLTANEGHDIVMGGSFLTPSFAFRFSNFYETNQLTITSLATPEPSTLGFMGGGLLFLLGGVRRLCNR